MEENTMQSCLKNIIFQWKLVQFIFVLHNFWAFKRIPFSFVTFIIFHFWIWLSWMGNGSIFLAVTLWVTHLVECFYLSIMNTNSYFNPLLRIRGIILGSTLVGPYFFITCYDVFRNGSATSFLQYLHSEQTC